MEHTRGVRFFVVNDVCIVKKLVRLLMRPTSQSGRISLSLKIVEKIDRNYIATPLLTSCRRRCSLLYNPRAQKMSTRLCVQRMRCCSHKLLRSCCNSTTSITSHCPVAHASTSAYSHTVLLPKPTFQSNLSAKKRRQLDQQLLESADAANLYEWQLKDSERSDLPSFTLLDGPPYANGPAHVGHAVNRTLKDFIVRYRVLRGNRVRHRPGWDWHGLPIELKVTRDTDDKNASSTTRTPLSIRQAARAVATESMCSQRTAFKQWALLADWGNPYVTDSNEYQARQLELFFRIYSRGLISREHRPVYWSPSAHTALAEAELEYNSEHVSPSVLCRFEIVDFPVDRLEALSSAIRKRRRKVDGAVFKIYALIWTTTPWTLPVNNAICYNPDADYVLVGPRYRKSPEISSTMPNELYIVSAAVSTSVFSDPSRWCVYSAPFNGEQLLRDCHYVDIMWRTMALTMQPAAHVKIASGDGSHGTGLVHTAYAHGFDDFTIAQRQSDPVHCFVDENGCYTRHLGPVLYGKSILSGEANESVLHLFKKDIVQLGQYQHSYPYDWRTKKPVIIRCCPQWFLDVSRVRDVALQMVDGIKFSNPADRNSLRASITNRPTWCISRQRAWGVPIPMLYRMDTQQPIVMAPQLVAHIVQAVREYGADIWWKWDIEQLAPRELLSACGVPSDVAVQRDNDVLDVWFDSGCAWHCATDSTSNSTADLVIEGLDQFRGWFQSLLWTACAADAPVPYKELVSHGFVVDENKEKMSKSIGNVIDPEQLISGGVKLNGDNMPALGVDGLRLWVASYGGGVETASVRINADIIKGVHTRIRQIRITIRFALGVTNDFDRSIHAISIDSMNSLIDIYMISELRVLLDRCEHSYERHDFSFVINETEKYLNGTFGAFYVSAVKDRLYCDAQNSASRRSAQTVIDRVLRSIAQILAPLLPHLADEVWMHVNSVQACHSIQQGWPTTATDINHNSTQTSTQTTMSTCLPLIRAFLSEHANDAAQLCVTLHIGADQELLWDNLQLLNRRTEQAAFTDLLNLLRAAEVRLIRGDYTNSDPTAPYAIKVSPTTNERCDRCRRWAVPANQRTALCQRCSSVIGQNDTEAKCKVHEAA